MKMQGSFRQRLHQAIPGGAHTYSRGDDQFPANAPEILSRGEGAYVFDADGRRFLDYGMGLRSVNVGYGNKEIADAAYAEILKGNNLTRASLTELEAAELFIDTIPSCEMVKFAKHGSTVTTAAIKLARAYTGKSYICLPRQHPFFSFDDWFIGSTIMSRGVPEGYSAYTLLFDFNDIDSLERLFEQYNGQIAAVITEPATTISPCGPECTYEKDCPRCADPDKNFLHQVKRLCEKNEALFILDEMITGYRWHYRGAQYFYNIRPDLTTFGKAMANGFAVAALGGRREIMEIGGILEEGKERVFLTSTTHGAEMSALGAFTKTCEVLQRDGVIDHVWDYGRKLKNGIKGIVAEMGLQGLFDVEGYPCSPSYIAKDANGAVSLPLRTLFAQEMIGQNVMMPYIALSYAHGDTELDLTLSAVRSALKIYRKAADGDVSKFLNGKAVKPVFRKFN